MKNGSFTRTCITKPPKTLFRFCVLLVNLCSFLSAQAVENDPPETITMGGKEIEYNPSFWQGYNFGTDAWVTTELTTTTVITGTVNSRHPIDLIHFRLEPGCEITAANISISNYKAASTTPSVGLSLYIFSNASDHGQNEFSENGIRSLSLSSSPARYFFVQITAPFVSSSGFQPPSWYWPNSNISTTGSASYVVTLTIVRKKIGLSQLVGSYQGIIRTGSNETFPNQALGARFGMTVTKVGTISGKMAFGPTIIPFTSRFTVTEGQVIPEIVIPIPAYHFSLVLVFGSEEYTYKGYFSGEAQQGEKNETIGSGFGWRNVWVNTPPKDHMKSQRDFYLKPEQRVAGPPEWSLVSIKPGAADGSYTVAGTLADGEKLLFTGFYSPTGEFLIYQYLYASSGKGSLHGFVSVGSYFNLDGFLTWLKQPIPILNPAPKVLKKYAKPPRKSLSDTFYPLGFEQLLTIP